MNKEVYHEGWLIKSPPTKRIWRARWRRRWFTLKQGEIPGQFCLEYYTDRNCRKLKGVIDLDQCEQVDSGLRLEHRKLKLQFMFDIKTPRRTYYLAADTESDMRDWVNCICQVCNLHDFTKQPGERQYYNLCENDAPMQSPPAAITSNSSTAETIETTLNSTNNSSILRSDNERQSIASEVIRRTEQISINNTYQNNDFPYVNSEYSNRETLICDSKLQDRAQSLEQKQHQRNVKISESPAKNIQQSSFNTIERSHSFKQSSGIEESPPVLPMHTRTQSLNEQSTTKMHVSSSGMVKKIPENLVLSNTANVETGSVEPSPALSTSSGPYIPISECFSGSPKFLSGENPTTPLNNLDPKFYDTPRSHNNIGLNLTNDQSYSPKINNCPQPQVRPRSGRSSPTDSESVFTDDEEWSHPMPLRENDRNLRPSDSSVENEAIVFTYSQRFSKVPDDGKTAKTDENGIPELDSKLLRRKNRLILESASEDEKARDIPQLSDTENTSPAIGPKDASSCVDEIYDIPRSHHLPYYRMSQFKDQIISPDDPVASSTPNLISDTESLSGTLGRTLQRQHYYTNAAPKKIEGNVFRYDFIEQNEVPPVNRSLKPKLSFEEKPTSEQTAKPPIPVPVTAAEKSPARPPSVDRKLKPHALRPQESTSYSSIRRPGVPGSLVLSSDTDFSINHKDLETRTLPRNTSGMSSSPGNATRNSTIPTTTTTQTKSNSTLQYFDLDVANPPPQISRAIYANSTYAGHGTRLSSSLEATSRAPVKSSVVYNSVDFIKTEAFKRVREDAEKSRMKE